MRRRNNPNMLVDRYEPVAITFHRDTPRQVQTITVERAAVDYDTLSDRALAAAFEAEFGKRPHHRMKRDTIVRKLNDACNECA